jgi:hypothetical protein
MSLLHHLIRTQQNVLGLQVSVGISIPVHKGETLQKLSGEGLNVVRREADVLVLLDDVVNRRP